MKNVFTDNEFNSFKNKYNTVAINGTTVSFYTSRLSALLDAKHFEDTCQDKRKYVPLKTKFGYLIQNDRGTVFDFGIKLSDDIVSNIPLS